MLNRLTVGQQEVYVEADRMLQKIQIFEKPGFPADAGLVQSKLRDRWVGI